MLQTQKIVDVALLVAGFFAYLFISKLADGVWGIVGLPRMSDWLVGPPAIIGFVVTGVAFVYTRRHEVANRFLNEVAIELSKASWPEKKETVISTGISCVLIVICALVLLLYDSLWGMISKGLFSL